MKRTKIVATIGPASESKNIIKKMVKAGLNVARLNFSHNIHRHHLFLIKNIRETAKELDLPVAIMQDLQGPRIRIGDINETGIKVKKNQKLILVYSLGPIKTKGKILKIPTHYSGLSQDLKIGEKILIDDGLIELKVEKINDGEVYCVVVIGGTIKPHKGMNFPNSNIKADALTKKDLEDLEFGIKNQVDFVALSFVRDAGDINNLRKYILKLEKQYGLQGRGQVLGQNKTLTKIIAKIERREAIKNFDRILKSVDGIMVARGDLGIELPFEDVPLIQKEIIRKCNGAGKPVIVATQMLDSMIRNPLPTRAEVSDVANAILDGADAVMLSGESATGKYPLLAVAAMKRIADEVEPVEFKIQQELESKLKRIKSSADFVAFTSQDMAEKLKAKAIICLTRSGHTARMIARYKSKIPLLAFSASEQIKNQLNLSWGIEPFKLDFIKKYSGLLANVFKILINKKKIKKGDLVLVCAGQTFSYFKKDNFIRIEEV